MSWPICEIHHCNYVNSKDHDGLVCPVCHPEMVEGDNVDRQKDQFQGSWHNIPPETIGPASADYCVTLSKAEIYAVPESPGKVLGKSISPIKKIQGEIPEPFRNKISKNTSEARYYSVPEHPGKALSPGKAMKKCISCGQSGLEGWHKYCPNCGKRFV